MMQLNIFQKVAPLLKEKKFNVDLDEFICFMGKYSVGDWIYPDAIHRELGIPIKDIYQILESCVEAEVVEQYLQIYCPFCQRFTGNIYESIMEIPEFINCVHCDSEIINPLQHAIIIYKVI